MLRCITEMKKGRRTSCSTAEGPELSLCVCGFVVCVYICSILCANKCVYMQSITHIVYSIACFYVCTWTDTSQPMVWFHLSSQSPYSPSAQEEYSYFRFCFDSSHLQKSCLLHFYPGPRKGSTVGERMQLEERIRPGGPQCALCARKEETSFSKMSLFVPKWLVCQPDLQRFCASGSTRSALLTQIHPGPHHLEDIMGNAWRGSLTPLKGSPVASRVKCSSNLLL